MADVFSKEKRSQIMGRIRGKDTAPELIVRSLLHKYGYRFRLHGSKLPGKPDIVLPKYKTVIMIHGCYWHRHKGCKRGSSTPVTNKKFWNEKFEKTVMRDKQKKLELENLGWKVITIWECETSDREKLLSTLKAQIS